MTQVRDIHRQLFEARVNAGLTQQGLADLLELEEHVIRRLEKGKPSRYPDRVKKVVDWLGEQGIECTVVDLIGLPNEAATGAAS